MTLQQSRRSNEFRFPSSQPSEVNQRMPPLQQVRIYSETLRDDLIWIRSGPRQSQLAGVQAVHSVKTACVMQYGNAVKEAKALNWNDPLSWVCVLW